MVDKGKGFMIGSLLLGTVLAIGLLAFRRRTSSKKKFPCTARWRPIGTLKNLLIFPMKSGGYVEVEEADCKELGAVQVNTNGLYSLKDRSFIVYREDNKEIMLCMTYPIMVSIKIQPNSENSVLFKFRDKPDLEVIIPTPNQDNSTNIKTKMWTEELMDCLDCGDEAADWVTEVIKGDKNAERKLRLGYWNFPNKRTIGTDNNYNERGAFQNYTSYMMMTSSSLEDLESKLPQSNLSFKQFRPNFLVETTMDPFVEDEWTWIRIGEETIFVKTKDCARCSQINIDPETSKFHPKQEPLKTLSKYRKKNEGPIMGICLGLYKTGKVKIGDPVYIPV